jgi:tetratricopeptide (TPR) repeat protein
LHKWKASVAAISRVFEDRLQQVQLAIANFERAGASRNACLDRIDLGYALMVVGMYSQAEAMLYDVLHEADRLGLTYAAASAHIALGYIYAARGGAEDGRLRIAEVAEEARARGNAFLEGLARIALARIWLALGALEQAEREAQAAAEITSSNPTLNAPVQAVMAQILLRTSRSVEALAAAKRGKKLLDSLGTVEEGDALIRLVFAEALHAVGDVDGARAALSIAHDSILRDAQRIRDEEIRSSFLNNVPEHARILALARAWAVSAS